MELTDEWKVKLLKEEIEHLKSFAEQTREDPEQHEGFKWILKEVRKWFKEIGKDANPDRDPILMIEDHEIPETSMN